MRSSPEIMPATVRAAGCNPTPPRAATPTTYPGCNPTPPGCNPVCVLGTGGRALDGEVGGGDRRVVARLDERDACNRKYPGCSRKYPGCNRKHPGCNRKYPGCNRKYPGCNRKHPGCNRKHPGCNRKHPGCNRKHPGCC